MSQVVSGNDNITVYMNLHHSDDELILIELNNEHGGAILEFSNFMLFDNEIYFGNDLNESPHITNIEGDFLLYNSNGFYFKVSESDYKHIRNTLVMLRTAKYFASFNTFYTSLKYGEDYLSILKSRVKVNTT